MVREDLEKQVFSYNHYKENLESSIKNLKPELSQLKEEILITEKENELLQQQKTELSADIKDREKMKGDLETACKTIFEKAKKKEAEVDATCLKKLKSANEKAEEIIQSTETKRDHILAGVRKEKEETQKKVEVLEAEKELLEVGMTPLLDQIHAEQDKLRAEREKAHKGEKPPSENFLQRLPDFEV